MYKILKVTIWDKNGKKLIKSYVPKLGKNDYICDDVNVFSSNISLTRPDLQVDLCYITTRPITKT